VKIEASICAWDFEDGSAFYAAISDGKSRIERTYAVPCTINQAELHAVRFAIASFPRMTHLRIITESYYLTGLLEREGKEWAKSVEANVDLVSAMRGAIRCPFEVQRVESVRH
jgi:ribonuclease HI